MATIQIELPDQLAEQAQRAGLLSPAKIEQLLREKLKSQSLDELFAAMRKMDAVDDPEVLTPEAAAEEIAAMRAERRAAAKAS
jgi:hypothetical protein